MPGKYATPLGPNGECDACGTPHRRNNRITCRGHVTTDRESYVKGQDRKKLDKPRPCYRDPRHGLPTCPSHGADNPVAVEAGKQRVAEQNAERLMRKFAGPIDTTPTEALLDTVRWTAGYVLWLRQAVEADDTDEGTAAKAAEWIDTLRKLCTDAIRNGIEERRVRFAESQGVIVAEVIKGIFADLDLTAEQLARVGEVVPLHLRRLMHVA